MIGVGRHVLYRGAEAGELPIYDPGGWARLRLTDLEAWLASTTKRVPGSRR
jgi:excisionase family DNA binding protein